ncbi:PREDICTED: carcinoembryonic antigen-related cell adhesion molecule 1 isoform X2 [Condylura cristata]|uniref:carcinoembryonic antigen-related cell adhesion molecule 1 isoform X2 n=1 Tax=Condylura cristata TaxID=143302 RepID=UPI00064321A0|nr:PREDICTED: carcinoembryonic antigen-related cell adhesion molecule 1 isoform X2 [Condylura cristata]
MEAPSAHGHRGRVPWTGILLAASLLAFWIPPGAAQLTIEPEPVNAIEGGNVTLHVRGLLKEVGIFKWYKGGKVDGETLIMSYKVGSPADGTGPAHSGRETINSNGSLLVWNVTQEDTGPYTLQITYRDFEEREVTGQLRVYPELPKPYITCNMTCNSDLVEQQGPVVLTCESESQNTTYLWSINSQSLPDSDRLQLSNDNRTLTLLQVTRNDTGPYVCETRNPVSARRSDPFTLNVLYGPDTPTIFPSESFYHPGDVLNLTCYADSNPPAQYSWLVNGRPQHPTQALFIPNITMSDSGAYTCQAHNNATGLNSTTVKNITVSESVAQPSIRASNSTVNEKDEVNLICITRDSGVTILWLFNNQIMKLTNHMALSKDNRTLTINPVRREDAGEYQCEASNPASSRRSDPFTLKVLSAGEEPGSSGLPPGAIAGIVIGVVTAVALLGSLGCFLHRRRTAGTIDQRDLTENKLSTSSHSQGHSDNLTNKTDEVAYSSLTFNAQGPKKPASSDPSPTATDTVYTEVKKK